MTEQSSDAVRRTYQEWQIALSEWGRMKTEHINGTPHTVDDFLPLIDRLNETMAKFGEAVAPFVGMR